VLDAGGGVIIGARIQATSYARNANDTHEPRGFQVDSDGDGRYRLRLPAGVHKVRVEADGYAGAAASIELLAALSRDFALQPAGRISGRVVSADRREPIAGAEVVAHPEEWRPSLSPPTATTNDQGRFVITSLPPGSYRITARTEGMRGAFDRSVGLEATDAVDDVEIAMRPTVTLRGQVTSVSGRPIGQARLTLSEPDRPGRLFGPSPSTLTDDEGRYLFEGVAPGRYRLAVSASDHAAHAEPIALRTAESRDVVLTNAAVVSGLVLKTNGKPAANAWVRAIVGANDPDRKISEMAMTDSAGRFSIKGLGAGELRLTASDRDEAATIGPEPLGTGSRKDLTIRLGAAASVAGVVRGEDGAPIGAEAVVSATILCEDGAIGSSHRTGEDGSFIIRGLPPGEVALQVRRRRDLGARTTLTLAAGEQRTGVDLVIAGR
jgi:hypothetical protein